MSPRLCVGYSEIAKYKTTENVQRNVQRTPNEFKLWKWGCRFVVNCHVDDCHVHGNDVCYVYGDGSCDDCD
ncbi:hypothetical protein PF005_g26938 [Phytophthora fragariae]|uniref:Uncharacterized protein n=1 Tax=Phytophthora fragariae TaxID=53985 RepID=A0A6A3Q1J6_9STRA|nr:hypothetical protein PF003_g37511 [Phytophthora fragariae]KAE8977068.1 hypothetical protein PF011_g23797 [Phytophthora fragariae]KAE9066939.1 hypothetical protein PF007_g28259 [Phytophthora fragariae]KAE9070487.1 hypothetical protein PF010_g26250 [Phytophthora fragariae]KAE9084783.1 hypothetical protein PF006_g26402 [Phytophthora fragariae]